MLDDAAALLPLLLLRRALPAPGGLQRPAKLPLVLCCLLHTPALLLCMCILA
jgi:hypothetical protein